MHVIASRKLGGAESFFTRLVSGLAAAGEEVMVGCRRGSMVCSALPDTFSKFQVPMLGGWDVWSRWKLGRTIAGYRPDIVQTYMARATVLTHVPRGTAAVHIARLGGYYNISRFRHASAWVGNTRGICDYLVRNGLPASRVFYIGNFVDSPAAVTAAQHLELQQQLCLPPDARVILAAGRMIKKKGFDTLLEAFSQLPERVDGRELRLLLLGAGPLREELYAQAGRLGIAARVHWAGWQTVLAPYFALADVFVCPSRHEPLGNVILEGWAHQRPVISTRTAGAEELIHDGRDGVLVAIDASREMAQAIEVMLHDEDRRLALARAGSARISNEFSKERIISSYIELYHRLTDS